MKFFVSIKIYKTCNNSNNRNNWITEYIKGYYIIGNNGHNMT